MLKVQSHSKSLESTMHMDMLPLSCQKIVLNRNVLISEYNVAFQLCMYLHAQNLGSSCHLKDFTLGLTIPTVHVSLSPLPSWEKDARLRNSLYALFFPTSSHACKP